jgi:DNA-binding transcriptional regulator YbjK
MPSNRERALDAAVDLLGTSGLRSLTHARVDAHAGLPKGSTSNYFRTRGALLAGVVEHMVVTETPAVGFATDVASGEELAQALTRVMDLLTGPGRTMTTARMVLLIEASHDPDLRAALAQGRRTMEEMIRPALVRLGAPDPQALLDAVAAAFEGMYLHRIARHADIDPLPVFRLILRGGLGPG